tara:strand:- start:484 stop:1545 length:1062 start_codon:yes stop_codon:yes gene_type:complete
MLYIVFYICFSFLLSSCATVIPPSGGEKDTSPPRVIDLLPSNQSVNFTKKEIVFYFDEYVQIKNQSEINFFPEIKPKPKIKTKGKSIIVEFLADLTPNTTHIINFNGSISDLNESNSLENFQYVFSTGGFIDTCRLSGSIFDLKYNLKKKGAKIGLFQEKLVENFDSLIRKSKPDYFILSDENGNYSFSNLKSGNYILYGFKDLNLSGYYENKEPVSMPIEITIKDSLKANIPLFIENQFLKKDTLSCLYKKDSLNMGSINLNFKKEIYDSGKYLGEIMLKDSSVTCFNINSKIIKIDSLLTGVYSFKMFEDANGNDFWDSGNIKNLISPEKLFFFGEDINIKKDWEIDIFIE